MEKPPHTGTFDFGTVKIGTGQSTELSGAHVHRFVETIVQDVVYALRNLSYVPARRASRIDPLVALRHE